MQTRLKAILAANIGREGARELDVMADRVTGFELAGARTRNHVGHFTLSSTTTASPAVNEFNQLRPSCSIDPIGELRSYSNHHPSAWILRVVLSLVWALPSSCTKSFSQHSLKMPISQRHAPYSAASAVCLLGNP